MSPTSVNFVSRDPRRADYDYQPGQCPSQTHRPQNLASVRTGPRWYLKNVSALLCASALNPGIDEFDVSAFEAKLRGDWFVEADRLRGRGSELSGYMPLLLAEEMYNFLQNDDPFGATR